MDYEFWLTDDAGRRIAFFSEISFASYSRTSHGLGTLLIGMPYDVYLAKVATLFSPDWRIDVHRSPAHGFDKRREGSFFMRKYRIYDRADDGLRMIQLYGRSPLDLLNRMMVKSEPHAGLIDDVMVDIVTEAYLDVVPSADEFSIDPSTSQGETTTQYAYGKSVRDALEDLKATSFTLHAEDSGNQKIYFDVVEGTGIEGGFGYIFRTYVGLRGRDIRSLLIFSPENGNMKEPEYSESYLDQITIAKVNNSTVTHPDATLSRWNNIYSYKSTAEVHAEANGAECRQILSDYGKVFLANAYVLSSPGNQNLGLPRSLYGLDWDMGDLITVDYAGKKIEAEIEIVWVSVNQNGQEYIVGQNRVGT